MSEAHGDGEPSTTRGEVEVRRDIKQQHYSNTVDD